MRHLLLRSGHGGGHAHLRRWSQPVSSSDVPEELIDQAMAVLQGKSREVIARELQTTVSPMGVVGYQMVLLSLCTCVEPGCEYGCQQPAEQG